MILNAVFLSTTEDMSSQRGQTGLGTCSKWKIFRLAKVPDSLNGNSKNREVVEINGCNIEMLPAGGKGFERQGKQQKWHLYNIAKGSAGEVRSLTYVILDNKLAPRDCIESLKRSRIRNRHPHLRPHALDKTS